MNQNLDNSTKLASGQILHFIRGSYPNSEKKNVIIDLQLAKKIISETDLLNCISEKSGLSGPDISAKNINLILWNNGGSWLRLFGLATKLDWDETYLYQQPAYNELLTNSRVVIKPDEADICFIPNYKCGYSSMWRFFRQHYASCAKKGTQTFSLNSKENVHRGAHEFTFSFIRNPTKRIESFYIDKFCREESHHNHKDYTEVYRNILGKSVIDPVDFIGFIGSIPADFADRHWKSLYENLHDKGVLLCDAVYDIRAHDAFIRDIQHWAPEASEMPQANETSGYDASAAREAFRSQELISLLNRLYPNDIQLYENVTSNNGVLRAK